MPNSDINYLIQEISSTDPVDTLDYYIKLSNHLDAIRKYIERASKDVDTNLFIENVIQIMDQFIAKHKDTSNNMTMFFYSVLLNDPFNKSKEDIIPTVIDYIRNSEYDIDHKLFLYRYVSHSIFVYAHFQTAENEIALWNLFTELVDIYKKSLPILEQLTPIPVEKRDPDLYVVLCSQFLNACHGPTKTALDRCKTIVTSMHKKVLLINSAECLSPVGNTYLYHSNLGNYNPEMTPAENVVWKDTTIPFFQCEQDMPNTETMTVLLQTIYNLAPSRIIDIAGDSILGNMCNNFIPTLAISLCPSLLVSSTEEYQALGQSITDHERHILEEVHFPSERIIESVFTSGLIDQQKTLTKADLGINDDRFNVIVIGGRLDAEATNEFANLILNSSDDICFNFCGIFKEYQFFIDTHPGLENRCRFLGFQDDILAVVEQMDLYVNPIRRGGGTSCVEALSKGIPVVTTYFGDVYANAGNAFAVDDYEAMLAMIHKYQTDKAFYQSQSAVAKQRAAILLDTDREFKRILSLCTK